MSDSPVPESSAPHRGFIDRSELPFLPRVRWRFWLPILFVLVAFPTVWLTRRAREGRLLRQRLLREHSSLTQDIGPEYLSHRTLFQHWISDAAGPYPGDFHTPDITYASLTAQPVLYARTRLGEIHGTDTAIAAIQHRYPDQLTACLGVESVFLREILSKGEFLLPSYVDYVRRTDDPDRLHALREDLLFRLRRDTGTILQGLRHRYFVLAVDEAPLSIDGPTRVYIWDVPAQRLVLRDRSDGDRVVLIPFRLAGMPGPPPHSGAPSRPATVSQHDCSVAGAVRSTLGAPLLGMDHAAQDTHDP